MYQSARPEYDKTTYAIIGAAMEVHNDLGPGFPEAIYRDAMVIAMAEKGISTYKEVAFDVEYHGQRVGQFRLDMLAAQEVVVEFKAASELTSQHEAQTIAYLTATGQEVALLINFGAEKLQYKRILPPRRVQNSPAYQQRLRAWKDKRHNNE